MKKLIIGALAAIGVFTLIGLGLMIAGVSTMDAGPAPFVATDGFQDPDVGFQDPDVGALTLEDVPTHVEGPTLTFEQAKVARCDEWTLTLTTRATATRPIEGAMLTATFLDDGGRVITTAEASVVSMEAGETRTVEFHSIDGVCPPQDAQVEFQVDLAF